MSESEIERALMYLAESEFKLENIVKAENLIRALEYKLGARA